MASETITIELDQPAPTEPGWYVCQHGELTHLFDVVRDDPENLCIMSMIGPVYNVLDYKGARWSRRINIPTSPDRAGTAAGG